MKVVLISTLLPFGHYSEILAHALYQNTNIDLTVYTNTNPENKRVKHCGKIKIVWKQGMWFFIGILRELKKDRPDIVHIHHEFRMYGGLGSMITFPVLLLLLKLQRYPVVTTIHGVVPQKNINRRFFYIFMVPPYIIHRPSLKLFFFLIYYTIGFFSTCVICHTSGMKKILETEYKIPPKKIHVLRPIVPHQIQASSAGNYFIYFGYMVRRKGIIPLLNEFKKFIKKFPAYRLILAGGTIDGQEEAQNEITSHIQKIHLEKNVSIYGYVATPAEMKKLYQRAGAALLPTEVSIAASGPLYHAQSYGKCVIASDIGFLREEITHNKNGYLVKQGKWADALQTIVTNQNLLQKLEAGSRREAQERAPRIMAQKYNEMYHSFMRT